MARFRKCPPTKNGILVGADAIAATFGITRRTLHRWSQRQGFPVATLPTGHIATSLGLIDLWLLGRLKPPDNIGKHSNAEAVNLSVKTTDGYVKLIVDDNGIGFNVEEALARRDSFGLSGMRERVALLGGTFQVESNPGVLTKRLQNASAETVGPQAPLRKSTRGRGTKIVIELPLPREADLRGASADAREYATRRLRVR